MNCRQVREKWHDVCDAGAEPAPEIDAHLRECEACRRYVRQMSSITDALDALHEATEQIVSVSPPKRHDVPFSRPIPQWRRPILASLRIAAVLALVIAGGLYLRRDRRDRRAAIHPSRVVPTQQASLELRGLSKEKYLAVHVDQRPTNEEPVDVIWLYRLAPPRPGGSPQSQIQVFPKEKQS